MKGTDMCSVPNESLRLCGQIRAKQEEDESDKRSSVQHTSGNSVSLIKNDGGRTG